MTIIITCKRNYQHVESFSLSLEELLAMDEHDAMIPMVRRQWAIFKGVVSQESFQEINATFVEHGNRIDVNIIKTSTPKEREVSHNKEYEKFRNTRATGVCQSALQLGGVDELDR